MEDIDVISRKLEQFIRLAKACQKKQRTLKSTDSVISKDTLSKHSDIHSWQKPHSWLLDVPKSVTQTDINKLDSQTISLLVNHIAAMAAKLKPHIVRGSGPIYRRGTFSYHKTFQESMKTYGEPFRLQYSARRRRLRNLITICDISGSVRKASALMLAFVYGLHQVFMGRDRHFVFVSEIDEATPYMSSSDSYNDFIDKVTRSLAIDYTGYSDYGYAIKRLYDKYGRIFDSNTIVIILGDLRSNRKDLNMNLYREMKMSTRGVFILNPDPPEKWGTGDSAVNDFRNEQFRIINISTFDALITFLRKFPGMVVRK